MPRRKARTRYPRYPARWPSVVFGALILCAGTLALLALGFMIAQPLPTENKGPFDELVTTAHRPGVTIALVVVAVLGIATGTRRLMSEWLAARPGGIDVRTFAAGGEVSDADAERWTLRFRQRFAELHLNATTPVPGAMADGYFLDVLSGSGVDSRNWLGSALSLVRASMPRYAWRVSGVLVQRAQAPRYGLTFQVVRLPDDGSPPTTIWGTSWDDVVRRGADQATAAILPRTRRCGKQWAGWRRYRMPGPLLEAYENAAGFEADRRYDEALNEYLSAAEQDPMNMPLRLRIGQLQEKLGLYIDALATYQGMRDVGKERRRRTRESRGANRERRRALVVARYRRIVLLGGSELAEQWRKTSVSGAEESLRDWRRRMLRDRLRPQLELELKDVADSHRVLPVDKPLSWREVFLGGRARPRRGNWNAVAVLSEPRRLTVEEAESPEAQERERIALFKLRELFALAAVRDLRGLLRQLKPRPWERKLILSRASVQLTESCIEVRLDWVQHVLADRRSTAWPPHPFRLDAAISQIEGMRRFDLWHEHYNAACVYALPLMADDIRQDDALSDLRDLLAEKAVKRLASATAHADSAYIAGRRDWLLSEDPDLDGLRTHPLFKEFETMNFPARNPTPFRPMGVKTLESARYVEALLSETATCWEQAWHARARQLSSWPDVHTLLDWWDHEREAWELVHEVALNNRYGPARVDLIHGLHDRAEAYGFAAPPIKFPRYAERVLTEEQLGEGEEERRKAAERVAGAMEKHFHKIGEVIRSALATLPDTTRPAHIAAWEEALQRLDTQGREPRRFLLAVLCDHHAGLWQLLREWAASEAGPTREKKRALFERQMDATEEIWCGADSWWRKPALIRAAAHRGARPALVFGRWASSRGPGAPVA